MKKQNRPLLHRLICLLMALHVINLSVDAPDNYLSAFQIGHHEDLSVNDIESLSELLLEEVFGFTNAVPEHDEQDGDSSLTESGEDYIFAQSFFFSPFLSPPHYLVADPIPYPFTSVPTPVADIVAPPPRFAA
ncbi:MAG: hypothetical protein H7Z72_16685 [Bacteroidetes bacterium]|nr:hypothetical protein [Fibrella sp.]